jgi:hypothetical protein
MHFPVLKARPGDSALSWPISKMKECAFCTHTGKLSAEHIASVWMRNLFPGKITARRYDHRTGKDSEWQWNFLDFKASVVCKKCNETWMSDIEEEHAKPALTPLITGNINIAIDKEKAHWIALFSFKTAVILDHSSRDRDSPFFEKESRHSFRKTLSIPTNVQMWLCPFRGHRGNGAFLTLYHQPELSTGENWLMYVCTFAIGNVAIQVVALKGKTERAFLRPNTGFEFLATPFWPALEPNYIWPTGHVLRSRENFNSLAERWRSIEIVD